MLGPKTASDSELSRGAVNPVIYLIFARCRVILVCWPLGKYNLHRAMLKMYGHGKSSREISVHTFIFGNLKVS